MKVNKEAVKAEGLTQLYEPDEASESCLNIIFVHGLGGHPVQTWQHTGSSAPPTPGPRAPTPVITPTTTTTVTSNSPSPTPTRSTSVIRYWASPSAKKGHTLTKHPHHHAPTHQQPPRPKSAEPMLFPTPTARREMRRELRRTRRAVADPGNNIQYHVARGGLGDLRRIETGATSTVQTPEVNGNRRPPVEKRVVYWPLDLLPESCPSARIFTFGYRTLMTEGQLIPGQLDIFARGRELLEAVEEVTRSDARGVRREVVFVAHSTGGIIVKEMLRLASSFSDTSSPSLLASLAGVVFFGAPLRDTNYGSMVIAMKSMAAATTGVALDDPVLAELLDDVFVTDNHEFQEHLAQRGREAFEAVWREYNFRVKTFRETGLEKVTRPMAALGVALRRDTSTLQDNPEEDEDIEADHAEMCRFTSARDDGYLSVASFINRLTHYQTLRRRDLTEREITILHAVDPSEEYSSESPDQTQPSASSPASPPTPPPWLLHHPHFRSWYHRNNREAAHKLLWLNGSFGCGQSALISSLHNHIRTQWASEAHSSAIIFVRAREGKSLLESVFLEEIISDDPRSSSSTSSFSSDDRYRGTPKAVNFLELSDDSVDETEDSRDEPSQQQHAIPKTPAGVLRSLVSQLYAHDPRLRNLVRKRAQLQAATPLHGDVFETPPSTGPVVNGRAQKKRTQKVYFAPLPTKENGHSSRSHLDSNGGAKNHDDGGDTPKNKLTPDTSEPITAADLNSKPLDGSVSKQRSERLVADGRKDADRKEERRWSDPASASTTDLLSAALARDWRPIEAVVLDAQQTSVRGARNRRKGGIRLQPVPNLTPLEDVDVVSLFLEDYLCLDPARERKRQSQSQIRRTSAPQRSATDRTDDRREKRTQGQIRNQSRDQSIVHIPGLRRVFILVDATTEICSREYTRGLLWSLSQLAERSNFSICVATSSSPRRMDMTSRSAGRSAMSRSTSRGTLPIMLEDNNAEEIRAYIEANLSPDVVEEREAIAGKMGERAGGVMLWAEMVCQIVNEAVEDGVSGEIILSMLDDISPRGRGRMDTLYEWKLRRLAAGSAEQTHARVVFQWVILAPDALRLNELLVALRLTLLSRTTTSRGRAWWDTGVSGAAALDVTPPMSLKDLRNGMGEQVGFGIAMDSPSLFWRWVQAVSQGLLRLESADGSGSGSGISNEPLGLQRVRPVDESVLHFFLKGRGFQTLLPPPEDPTEKLPSTERFIDTSYYSLLHACLRYLNMTELDLLGRENKPVNPAPGEDLPPEETSKWRKHAEDQRKMVMSSYPFLQYAVDHLVFHLLCPRQFRYFLPQKELLQLLTANRCRIWRRWTHLLGFSIADAEPQVILDQACEGAARKLLDPVYGATYRLGRVLKKVWKTASDAQKNNGGAPLATPRRAHFRTTSDVSDSSMVFMLVGGDDPLKSQWLMPASPRSMPGSSSNNSNSNASPATPRSPGMNGQTPSYPRTLAGIQERG